MKGPNLVKKGCPGSLFLFKGETLFLQTMKGQSRFRVFILILYCILTGTKIIAQTHDEWAQTVNWDGITHWSDYIKSTAGNMGPNALPVPFISNGSIDSNTWLGATGHFHFRKGDQTQNLALYANYCLIKEVVTVDFAFVPVEHFTMSDALKKERKVFYPRYYSRYARGDVYMNGTVRIFRKWEKSIRMALRFGFRLPSSNQLEAARFTDNMGYHVDLSFGKPLSPRLKWIGMAGLYVWGMTGKSHRQDDAFLFGTGLEWEKNGWKLQGYTAGYLGYLQNSGDKPVLLRTHTEKRIKNTSLLLRLQQGIQDFKYSSVELGAKFFFKRQAPAIIR